MYIIKLCFKSNNILFDKQIKLQFILYYSFENNISHYKFTIDFYVIF